MAKVYPIGTNVRDITEFDRGIKVVFHCKEHPEFHYASKDPFVSNWFPANQAAIDIQFQINEPCEHMIKHDVWFTVREYKPFDFSTDERDG